MLSEADWYSCALGCILHLLPQGLPALKLWGWGPSISHIWFVVFITLKINLLYETPTLQTSLMLWLIRILRKHWVIVTAWDKTCLLLQCCPENWAGFPLDSATHPKAMPGAGHFHPSQKLFSVLLMQYLRCPQMCELQAVDAALAYTPIPCAQRL